MDKPNPIVCHRKLEEVLTNKYGFTRLTSAEKDTFLLVWIDEAVFITTSPLRVLIVKTEDELEQVMLMPNYETRMCLIKDMRYKEFEKDLQSVQE